MKTKKENKDSLHVKYRPDTWDNVLGAKNKETVKSLIPVLKQGKQRSFLLIGEHGCGKTSIARLIAKEVGCDLSCFVEIDAAKYRGIDTIKHLLQGEGTYAPIFGDVTVVLLDEAHQLTTEGQNALLTSLDEPPSHLYWVLATTNPEKLLVTIRSRCDEYKVYPLEQPGTMELLLNTVEKENIEVPKAVLQKIAELSNGIPREAMVWLGRIIDFLNEHPGADEKELLARLGVVVEPIIEEPVEVPELSYPTSHLKNFEQLDDAIRLYGKDYKLLVKAVWYILFGQVIRPKIAKLGDNVSDCRMNFIFVVDSGKGKGNLKSVITEICESLGQEVGTNEQGHPEALIGTTAKNKGFTQTLGALSSDILIFDDEDRLVCGRDPWNSINRKYMTKALNLYGKNRITKPQAGVPKEHQISYLPKCSIQVLMHIDEEIPSEVISKGFFRRFLFLFPDIVFDDSIYDKRIDSITDNAQSLKILTDHLKEIQNWWKPSVPSTANLFTYKPPTTLELIFSEAAVERFRILHRLLIKFGKGHGKKVSKYTDMIGCSLENLFLGMIVILASSQMKNEIGDDVVELAFVDLIEFLDSNFKYIEEKVKGDIASGKKHPVGDDLNTCEWLKEIGGTSVANLKNKIGITQYKKFKKNKWIKSAQIGKYGSKVWLTVNLDGGKEDDSKISEVMKEYRKIIDSHPQVEIKFKAVGRMVRLEDIEFSETSLMS